MPSEGLVNDQALLAITQVTETSTKLPLLFPGDLIEFGSVGDFKDPKLMLDSISIFRSMPGSSIFFPKYNRPKRNFDWIKKLNPENQYIKGME